MTEPAADVLRAAYRQAMLERRDPVDLAVVKEAAAVARGVLLEKLGGVKLEGTGDAPQLREARWWVRREAAFTPTDPRWGAAVVAAVPELVRRLPGPAYTPLLGAAAQAGVLEQPGRVAGWLNGIAGRLLHRSDRAGGPVLVLLELEAARQAVLLGRAVDSAAVLLAVLSLDEQLAAGGRQLRSQYAADNQGATMLRGLTLAKAQAAAVDAPQETGLSPRQLAWGHTEVDPPWTTAAAAVWDAAHGHGGPRTGTSHLVRALSLVGAPAAAALL